MPLLQHLNELRQRVFKAGAAVLLATAACFVIAPQLIDYLAGPIGGKDALVSIEVTENISIFMRVSVLGGLIFSMPVIIYQSMRFILPGLKANEKRWLMLGVPFASLLFVTGVAFTWFVTLPTAIPFLVDFMGITTQVRPSNYFEFVTKLMFWIGLSFEMPLVVFMLAKFNFVTAHQLANGWRYALVGIAVVGAMITPTVDPINMLLVMAPLMVLYVISIALARVAGRGQT
jgi:sec-independent protein translocase protein TatC